MSVSPIVIIDGDCAFCRYCAEYLRRHDVNKSLQIESYDLEKHQHVTSEERPRSVLFIKNGITYLHDEAVLRILSELNIRHRLLAKLLRLVPGFIRKAVYRFIAKRRKQLIKNPIC